MVTSDIMMIDTGWTKNTGTNDKPATTIVISSPAVTGGSKMVGKP